MAAGPRGRAATGTRREAAGSRRAPPVHATASARIRGRRVALDRQGSPGRTTSSDRGAMPSVAGREWTSRPDQPRGERRPGTPCASVTRTACGGCATAAGGFTCWCCWSSSPPSTAPCLPPSACVGGRCVLLRCARRSWVGERVALDGNERCPTDISDALQVLPLLQYPCETMLTANKNTPRRTLQSKRASAPRTVAATSFF